MKSLLTVLLVAILLFVGFDTTAQSTRQALVINEFMASNESTVTDEAGEFDDWVEIYNTSDEAVETGGLFLSDNPDRPDKWALPDVTIPAKGYLLIWTDEDGSQGELHANFKLSKDGEIITLHDSTANGLVLMDEIEFGPQTTDVSSGRFPDGADNMENLAPTPGSSNGKLNNINLRTLQAVELYPNPTNQAFTLQLGQAAKDIESIEVRSLSGQVMTKVRQVDQPAYVFETQDWAQGVYLVEIVLLSGERFIKKLLREF